MAKKKEENKDKVVKTKKRTTKKVENPKVESTKKVKAKPAKQTSKAKSSAKKSNAKKYSKKDLEMFRDVILTKKSEIIEQLQNLKDQMMDSSTGQYVNENSPYSLHMAEQGTDAQEREKLYLWAQRESKFLGYLEDSLKRIDNGTYGICIECIDEPKNLCPTCPLIPKARLMAVPHTQHCVEIKNKASKK